MSHPTPPRSTPSPTPTFLVVNDDGWGSPYLAPLVAALGRLGRVRVAVPAHEQSWQGKAMSRHRPVQVERREGLGVEAYAVAGTPADCVNLAIHRLFADPPDWVVSGVNIGWNTGLTFALNSGTIGAAIEGALNGLPAVAFSQKVAPEHYQQWMREGRVTGAGSEAMVQAAGERVAAMMARLVAHGLPPGAMLLNVNFPRDLAATTPVGWAPLLDNRYGALFALEGSAYRHQYRSDAWADTGTRSDRAVVERGGISVTALSLQGLSLPAADDDPFA
jgi:5'-nucleotidase